MLFNTSLLQVGAICLTAAACRNLTPLSSGAGTRVCGAHLEDVLGEIAHGALGQAAHVLAGRQHNLVHHLRQGNRVAACPLLWARLLDGRSAHVAELVSVNTLQVEGPLVDCCDPNHLMPRASDTLDTLLSCLNATPGETSPLVKPEPSNAQQPVFADRRSTGRVHS